MIRQHFPAALQGEADFRWRGGDVSRIEGLSDAVFALSLTLLVVSLEVPSTFDQMLAAFRQLPAFAACFAILMMCWYFHFLYHRRYGLEDFGTIAINALLLFVILFYVYPLKFLFTLLFDLWFGADVSVTLSDGSVVDPIRNAQMPTLMLLYSSGFATIFALFAWLEIRAWAKREALELDERERKINRLTLRSHLISFGVGLLSMAIVLVNPRWSPGAGLIYMVLGPVQSLHGWLSGRAVERLRPK